MDCATCHATVPDDAHFCPACGAKITPAVTGPTKRLHQSDGLRCLRCGSAMEEGFSLEFDGHERRRRTSWVAGEPERNIWHGDVSTRNKRVLRIRMFRCIKCGYLESYARDGDDSKL